MLSQVTYHAGSQITRCPYWCASRTRHWLFPGVLCISLPLPVSSYCPRVLHIYIQGLTKGEQLKTPASPLAKSNSKSHNKAGDASSIDKNVCPACTRSWVQVPEQHKPGTMAHSCNPCTQEVKAEGPKDHSWLHSKFKDSSGHMKCCAFPTRPFPSHEI